MRLFTRVVAALGAYLALLGISFWVFGSLRESVTWSLDGTSLHIAWWGAAMLAQIGAVFLVCALIARFHREHGTRALKIGGNAVLLSVFFHGPMTLGLLPLLAIVPLSTTCPLYSPYVHASGVASWGGWIHEDFIFEFIGFDLRHFLTVIRPPTPHDSVPTPGGLESWWPAIAILGAYLACGVLITSALFAAEKRFLVSASFGRVAAWFGLILVSLALPFGFLVLDHLLDWDILSKMDRYAALWTITIAPFVIVLVGGPMLARMIRPRLPATGAAA